MLDDETNDAAQNDNECLNYYEILCGERPMQSGGYSNADHAANRSSGIEKNVGNAHDGVLGRLTFDMRGGRRAQPFDRPLDGRVRAHSWYCVLLRQAGQHCWSSNGHDLTLNWYFKPDLLRMHCDAMILLRP